MNRTSRRPHRGGGARLGATLTEVLVLTATLALLLAVVLPVTGGGVRGNSGIQQSMSNLLAMSAVHLLYAADWDGRQVTWVRDDLGTADSIQEYNAKAGCSSFPWDPPCQPGMIAGMDCDGAGPWGYWPNIANGPLINPLVFPDTPGAPAWSIGFGHFRIPNLRPFHDYLNGRYHDPVYYAPNDAPLFDLIQDCISSPCEFTIHFHNHYGECNPAWSSYAMSPAAMFHPDVMRSNAAGGWQNPWSLDYGFQSPGLFQATYPDLKTHMIEHSWIQDPPAPCNPAYMGCEPYWFNQGIGSTPVTLFYDGSVRLLPNTEVFAADQQVLMQTGGVDGLWHRGTSFGEDGYFISYGYDAVPLSHHVLTTDGILGRDTVSGTAPKPADLAWRRPATDGKPRPPVDFVGVIPRDPPPFSTDEDLP